MTLNFGIAILNADNDQGMALVKKYLTAETKNCGRADIFGGRAWQEQSPTMDESCP